MTDALWWSAWWAMKSKDAFQNHVPVIFTPDTFQKVESIHLRDKSFPLFSTIFHYTMSMMYQALSLQDDNMFAIPTTCLGQCMKLPSNPNSEASNLLQPPEVQWSKHLKTQTITFKHVEILWNFHDISMDFIEDLFFLDPPKRIKKEPGGTWNRSSDPPWLLSQ